jgi:hypothetical protein
MFQFARQAQDIELIFNDKREQESASVALGAITASAAFLECLINEVFIVAEVDNADPYGQLNQDARKSMAALWDEVGAKVSVLAKYDLALALNTRPPLDHGANPYQDVDALIQLRNAVMHFRMPWRPHPDPEPIAIEKRLKGKFPGSPYYRNVKIPLFPHDCLAAGCAAWAARSARALADDFHQRLGVVGYYQKLSNIPTLM